MSKELPFFKFEPAEYLTKDISFCSLQSQGLFINICCYYWQRNCKLTKTQLLRRLNCEKELKELIQEGIIDINKEEIIIKFLLFQYNEIQSISKINSVNGSKGGRPKKSETKPKLKPIKSESKGIREDKIIEENIKIDNSIFIKKCLSDLQWLEITAMQNFVKIEVIKLFLTTFENHLITMEEQKNDLKKFKEHFIHWLNKQDLKQFRVKKVGKTNQV